jgi:hypothetical protein
LLSEYVRHEDSLIHSHTTMYATLTSILFAAFVLSLGYVTTQGVARFGDLVAAAAAFSGALIALAWAITLTRTVGSSALWKAGAMEIELRQLGAWAAGTGPEPILIFARHRARFPLGSFGTADNIRAEFTKVGLPPPSPAALAIIRQKIHPRVQEVPPLKLGLETYPPADIWQNIPWLFLGMWAFCLAGLGVFGLQPQAASGFLRWAETLFSNGYVVLGAAGFFLGILLGFLLHARFVGAALKAEIQAPILRSASVAPSPPPPTESSNGLAKPRGPGPPDSPQ